MNKKYILGALILIVAAASIFGVVKIFNSSPITGNTIKEDASNAPLKEFAIESFTEVIDGKYYPKFSPNKLTVNKGDLVKIKITNIKGTHDFKIDEFGIYTETPLNQEMTVEFVADKVGSFEYYCTKPGHRQNGQWGTLKVLE